MTTTLVGAPPASLLTVGDLRAPHVRRLLELATRMREPYGWTSRLQGRTVACYFAKPSTRTRVSFEVAAHRLGLLPIMLRPDELQLGRGEPIADTARVLGGYCNGIVARVFDHAILEQMADVAEVPVINALSDAHHPCQALADLLTLRDAFDVVMGLKVAYVGALTNVARSLMEIGALMGVEVVVATPRGYGCDDDELRRINRLGHAVGGTARLVEDPAEAVHAADAVYTDVWVSMGEDDQAEQRRHDLEPYRVTAELMQRASRRAIFLHCLPAHRGEEVEAAVIDSPRSWVFKQAANRMPTAQAVLYAFLTGDWWTEE